MSLEQMNNNFTYEFEYTTEEGVMLAIPFDFEGGTFGSDYPSAALSASDWLRETIADHLIHDRPLPKATFNNTPRQQGTTGIVTVSVSLDELHTVSAGDAAELLGVSKARVSQLVKENLLDAYLVGRSVWVTLESIKARIAKQPKAGRPKKSTAGYLQGFKPTIVPQKGKDLSTTHNSQQTRQHERRLEM